ncbi:MAG TPA: carboxypeptidase regulatory-like domain-containing protein [Acidobacteriaceae bacterium]|nr:carboxypeptidase regulatory-like domain-containing protein [Acidobacteriaceae bacterium]
MLTRLSGIVASILALTFFTCSAFGQVTTGTILGTVHDSSGAVVNDATVTITDTSKGTVSQYKTDANGDYNVPYLIPGSYSISVEKQGFKRSVSSDVVLDVDQHARVDFTMQIGQVAETVEVAASAPLIRLDSAELGEVIGKRQVEQLPLNGRNFAQLVYLVPGVTPGQAGENLSGSSSFNPRAASDFNALGSQANSSAWVIDGIDDNEWTFNTVMVQPSVESVAEFKVLTGTYSAEFGRGSGVVSVSTRSGSNAFHGEAFDYLRNSYMDARNYFNPPPQLQPAYRRNQFGAAVGGRIIRDKLFFFSDYYGQRSLKGIVNLNSVPTAAERTGDFSNYRNAAGQLITIYNPYSTTVVNGVATRTPFPNNIIPANLLNQVGLNVASIYPLPQTSGSFNNYTSAANQIIDDNGGNGRIDYRLGDKDSMFGRFSYERFVQTTPNPLTGAQGTCCLPTPAAAAKTFDLGPQVAGEQNTTLIAQGLALNETHVFNVGLINEFRTGYARTNPFTTQSDFGHQAATSLGIQGVNVNPYATGLPNIQIGSGCGAEFTCIQGGQAFLPAHPVQTNIQVEDAVSWTRGRHQLKFGGRYIKQMASPFTNTTTRGQFTFNDNFTNNPQDTSGKLTGPNGSGLAALLLGFPNSGSRNFLQQTYFVTDGEWAAYGVDDWKVSPRLTVNLGLRYEVYTPETERHNRLANFNYKTMSFIYAGLNGVDRHAGMQTRYGDIAPRIGFSYDTSGNGTMVIRGGYGITYFPLPYSASDELGQNPPFTVSQTFTAPTTNPVGSQFSTPCTPNNLGSNCLVAINNPFPQGVTTVPQSVTTNTALLNAAAPAIISHQLSNPTPYMQMWNLDIERQLSGSGLLEIAYAGSHSIHLTYAYNPNEVQPGTPGVGSAGTLASRRLIQPLNNISTWVQEDEINASNYNALEVKYTKRYSHGLTALVGYTYSKSLDYGGSAASGGGSAGNPQTVTCLKCGYGASGFDQKHRFVASVNYLLPFGQGRAFAQHGAAAWALGGWEVDGIITMNTGNPFTVTLNNGVNFGAPSWPNRIAKGTVSNPKPTRWFDTTAFVAPPFNTYGNSARSVLYGPGTANADLSLQRTIPIKESVSVTLRGDAFNALNHPNFLNPNASIGSPNAGVISGTNLDNRDMQVSATLVF